MIWEKSLSNNRYLTIIYDRENYKEVVGRGSPSLISQMNLASP